GVGPVAVRDRVIPRDVDDRVVLQVGDRRARARRMAPVGPADRQPPRGGVQGVQYVRPRRLDGQVEYGRDPELLGVGDVAGGLAEGGELRIGHRGLVHPERAQAHLVERQLAVRRVTLVEVVTHDEGATGYGHLTTTRWTSLPRGSWRTGRSVPGRGGPRPGCGRSASGRGRRRAAAAHCPGSLVTRSARRSATRWSIASRRSAGTP